jgi:hypothetical protein
MARRKNKRVFISFDYDNDRSLKDLVYGQARNRRSGFRIVNWSMKETAAERSWKRKARERIRRSDLVMVVAGRKTKSALGVREEVKIAREEGVKVVQLIGYGAKKCPRVPNAGRRYEWTRQNLRRILR